MPDRLIIQDLAAECRLGAYDWEREKPQPVWFDIELAIDARKAARRDDVRDAVDYAALVKRVKAVAAARAYKLLETLAEEAAREILSGTGAKEVRLRVKKRALPGIDFAAVEVIRASRAKLLQRRLRAGWRPRAAASR